MVPNPENHDLWGRVDRYGSTPARVSLFGHVYQWFDCSGWFHRALCQSELPWPIKIRSRLL